MSATRFITPQELEQQHPYMDLVRQYYHMRQKTPLACVHTYGCQQNVSDSEHIKGILAQMGFGFTEDNEQADLILFNTCAVREHAVDRVFGNVFSATSVHSKRSSGAARPC